MENFKLEMYQRVYRYALEVVKFIKKMPNNLDSQVLGKQLLRSGTSVAANLIEAKSASSKKDYINFYQHALKSANESKFWLALIRDTCNQSNDEIKELLKETLEIGNILAASIITMKNKR